MSQDITSETIKTILEIAKPEVVEVEDAKGVVANYSTKPLHQIEARKGELPADIDVVSLLGFADLVRAKLEDANFAKDYLIHIEDESTVSLKSRVSDVYGRRWVLALAKPVEFDRFLFGRFLPQEEFVIGVAALFADTTDDKNYVLSLASTLTDELTSVSEDDGISQTAKVRRGLQLKDSVVVKPRVRLAPYRTFPDAEQPASEFVFRAKTENGVPKLALIEADGGRWKLAAIAEIKRVLEGFDLGVSIVA